VIPRTAVRLSGRRPRKVVIAGQQQDSKQHNPDGRHDHGKHQADDAKGKIYHAKGNISAR